MEDVFGLGKHNKVLQDRRWDEYIALGCLSMAFHTDYKQVNMVDSSIMMEIYS